MKSFHLQECVFLRTPGHGHYSQKWLLTSFWRSNAFICVNVYEKDTRNDITFIQSQKKIIYLQAPLYPSSDGIEWGVDEEKLRQMQKFPQYIDKRSSIWFEIW